MRPARVTAGHDFLRLTAAARGARVESFGTDLFRSGDLR